MRRAEVCTPAVYRLACHSLWLLQQLQGCLAGTLGGHYATAEIMSIAFTPARLDRDEVVAILPEIGIPSEPLVGDTVCSSGPKWPVELRGGEMVGLIALEMWL